MSDRMRPIPFDKLVNWVLTEYKNDGAVFGVHNPYSKQNSKVLNLFGEKMETPFGPAAGPHTQLAQNIIAAYFTGSRFFELKTVQTLDGEDLPVAKPCINAEDECYNVEWSTELRVPEAFEEYVKAWYLLKLISHEFDFGADDGFMFNMSVGYDLEGIQSQKIDTFIEGLKDASSTDIWRECEAFTLANLEHFEHVDEEFVQGISPRVCTSITLSTLHGCPPLEIERIATYLITQKGLNTYIKCNPTLLGYEFARKTMDEMGYDYLVFDDHHFNSDLQFEDAVPMIQRLLALAAQNNLTFGVKLTNTFPVGIARDELPGTEMYMSGRSLYPLTVALANKLSREFQGKLRISYSGGADIFNIEKLFDCGIWPITIATTLLKPGGYQRITQIAQALDTHKFQDFEGVDLAKIAALAQEAVKDPHHIKAIKPLPNRKMTRQVPLLDCFTAPCQDGCPIGQDIPAYVRLVGEGKYLEALEVITEKNPLPFITGAICPHHCADKCTRAFYDESVKIRAAKLEAANNGYNRLMAEMATPKTKGKTKVAIIGGGPAGLAAAYFLGKQGIKATVFEKKKELGGIVKLVIPEFRIPSEYILRDINLVRGMGAEFVMGSEQTSAEDLKARGYKYVLFATGAWLHGEMRLETGEAMNVLDFLEAYKNGQTMFLGKNIVIIGGGNTAMDAARAAKRIRGVEKVSLVYRRTKRYMPADEEELTLALQDGVEFCELLAPIGVKDGVLRCYKMALGEPDESGRRSPVQTEEVVEVLADTVIAAIGEKVDTALYEKNGIEVDGRGRPIVGAGFKTNVDSVFVAGDALRGPATVVEAIADAMKFAKAISKLETAHYEELNVNPNPASAMRKKGILLAVESNAHKQSERCLECATVCECCVEVCPNRANLAIKVGTNPMAQIIHVDGMCNECGNCASFCPYDSRPYKDKFTLFESNADFEDSTNEGFFCVDGQASTFRVRLDGEVKDYNISDQKCGLPEGIRKLIATVYVEYGYLFN